MNDPIQRGMIAGILGSVGDTAPRPFLHRTELEALVDFVSHTAFGLIATFYLVKLSKINAV